MSSEYLAETRYKTHKEMESQGVFGQFDIQTEQVTILAVDDSVPSARLLQTQLKRAGYEVIVAHDGEQALMEVERSLPDLIILDVMMPGLDGFTVCERIKSDPKTWFIPVILLTALNRIEDRIQGIEAGADDFLSKPFNREELLARVRSLLRLKGAYDALHTERNRLALLYDIGQEINSRLALDEVLGKIVTRTRDALGASMCSIILRGETEGMAQQIISRQGHAPGIAGKVTPTVVQDGLAGWVLRHRESTIVADTAQDQRWLILPGDTEPVGSAIAAPLQVGQEIIGVVLLTHGAAGFFDESHMAVLSSIAAQAAITVRNARLYESEQRRRRELEMLQAASVAVSAELNRDALARLIVHRGTILLNAPSASLMMLDESEAFLTVQAWWGLSERYVRRERVPKGQFLELLLDGKRSFQIADLRQQQLGRSDLAVQEGLVSQLSLALVASGQFMGALNFYSQETPRRFELEELKLAETFAQQAAIALSNAMLLERTREERGKMSAVLSSTTDAVLAVDEAGDLILANPAAERTFGLSSAQSLGRPLAGQVPAQLLELFEQVAIGGKPVSVEISTGHKRVLYVSVSPVMGVGQVAVVQDITPLKELETMRLVAEQEERRRLHHIFEQYVGPELVGRILAQKAGMLERRERRDVVVLFTDLRGFTRLTATSSAHAVIEVLNEFFTAVVEVVYKHQGTVFDLAGDELMVGFGAPFDQEDSSQRALRAAGDMQGIFAKLRRRWEEEQGIQVGLGVGIDRGPVVMGSIGAPTRMNYGMVGNAVNTAHRLVELAQHGEIIVSAEIVKSLNGAMEGWDFEQLPSVELKGKTLPLQIYLARAQ
jgi:PAS domain S-box-containing protein